MLQQEGWDFDCGGCLKEAALLSEELAGVRRQLEDSAERQETDDDAMYHLQMAQATLNERYATLQKKNTELQKRLDQKMMKLVTVFLSSFCVESHSIRTLWLTCFISFI